MINLIIIPKSNYAFRGRNGHICETLRHTLTYLGRWSSLSVWRNRLTGCISPLLALRSALPYLVLMPTAGLFMLAYKSVIAGNGQAQPQEFPISLFFLLVGVVAKVFLKKNL